MRLSILFLTGVCVLVCATEGRSQHKYRPASEITGSYEAQVRKINDELDALYRKINDESLSMAEAARLIDQQSALRKKADSYWNETTKAMNESFMAKRDEFNKFNSTNMELEFKSAISGSATDLLNNVAKYPNKTDFESNKSAMSKTWEDTYGSRLKPFGEKFAAEKDAWFKTLKDDYGIDLVKDGYARIGTYNPYTGEVFYKYYGKDKDGVERLQLAVWENDAKGWEKSNEAFRASRKRQQEWKESLAKDAEALKTGDSALKGLRKDSAGAMAKVENVAKRVNFVGGWRGGDTTGNNNTVGLRLNSDGTLTYSWSRANASYSGGGTWQQTGRQITAQTNDGKYDLRSSITEDFRLEFNVTEQGTGSFRVYLNR
jgi:hypothetical protein